MVFFELNDEQRAIQELAHQFAQREIRPAAAALDRDPTFPRSLVEKAWELGLMNLNIPTLYGGLGLTHLVEVLIAEELAWGCAAISTSIVTNALGSTPILLAGSEGLKRRFLGRLTESPTLVSLCMTEPDAGSDVSGIRTIAKRRGHAYVLTGSKCFITNGSHADSYTVLAKTDPSAGHRGLSAFVVPRDAGVVIDKHEDKLGLRASDTASLTFDGVEIPCDHRLGQEGDGFKLVMTTLDRTRPSIAGMAVGVARAAFEHATAYSVQRRQFGAPLAMLQGIQFIIADMATEIEAARLLTWKAAALLDAGRPNTLAAAHAKRFAGDTAMKVATDAVQVYGGYGFIKDFPVEKLFRDAKIMQLYEGTSQIQRVVIARETYAR